MDAYLDSRKLNLDCKKAIEEAIRENFDGLHLKQDAAKEVVERFGEERMNFVMANTIRELSHDGRFSRQKKHYLDLAEDRAERHIPMTMEDWSKRLDLFLMADDREVLQDAGKITAEIAKAKAETEFEKYRVIQDRLFMSDFDKYMLELEENAKK